MIDLGMHGWSHERVLAALCGERGLRDTRYRIDVLRGGIRVGELGYTDCALELDAAAEVKYCGRIVAGKCDGFDWRRDRLQPVMSLERDGLLFEFAFPPLVPVTVSEQVEGGAVCQSIEAYDETVRFQENSLGEMLFLPAGTLYTAAVERLLHDRGARQVNVEPCALALEEDREDWEEDDPVLGVVNALLGEIGYESLTVDRDGVLVCGKYREAGPVAGIRYTAGGDSVLRADKLVESDSYRRPNRFVGLVFHAGMEEPWRCEWVNSDPASPSSVPNTGEVRTEVLRFDHVADYATLRDRVHRHAVETAASYEHARLYTAILPHHGVRETVEVEAFGLHGVYEETGWRIDRFAPGGWMEHRLRKVVFA